jgi:preprotein translocase subunit SecA
VFLVSLPGEINSFFQSPDYVLSTWSGYREDKEDKHVDSIKPAIPQKAVSEKIGRNDLCPCGSGKKYKKCCMNN